MMLKAFATWWAPAPAFHDMDMDGAFLNLAEEKGGAHLL